MAKNSRYAANNQTTDNVTWTTADPVSGTKGTFGFSGTSRSVETEEREPLGQRLTLIDPASPEFPEFPPNEKAGSADDSHWQCEAGKKFWGERFVGMPFHCQKKAVFEADRLPWEDEKPESPVMIDSPLPTMDLPANNSMSDAMLTYALKSTSKKSKDDKKCKEENGEVTCGEPVAGVEVKGDQSSLISIPDYKDASMGGLSKYFNSVKNGDYSQLLFKDIQGVRSFLSDSLSNNCKEGVTDLISALEEVTGERAITYDLLALFDDIVKNQKEGGIYFNLTTDSQMLSAVNSARKEAYGKVREETRLCYGFTFRGPVTERSKGLFRGDFEAYIFILSRGYRTGNRRGAVVSAGSILKVLIHELIHASASLPKSSEKFTNTYKDDMYEEAAKKLGVQGFDIYIEDNCKPK